MHERESFQCKKCKKIYVGKKVLRSHICTTEDIQKDENVNTNSNETVLPNIGETVDKLIAETIINQSLVGMGNSTLEEIDKENVGNGSNVENMISLLGQRLSDVDNSAKEDDNENTVKKEKTDNTINGIDRATIESDIENFTKEKDFEEENNKDKNKKEELEDKESNADVDDNKSDDSDWLPPSDQDQVNNKGDYQFLYILGKLMLI